jgi:hypothetical protein
MTSVIALGVASSGAHFEQDRPGPPGTAGAAPQRAPDSSRRGDVGGGRAERRHDRFGHGGIGLRGREQAELEGAQNHRGAGREAERVEAHLGHLASTLTRARRA